MQTMCPVKRCQPEQRKTDVTAGLQTYSLPQPTSWTPYAGEQSADGSVGWPFALLMADT
jgi:hypothetical protein